MGEFHERCSVISNQTRAIHPFVTFVFQKCPVEELVENTQPGQKVELSILRDGQEQKLTVELGERPNSVRR